MISPPEAIRSFPFRKFADVVLCSPMAHVPTQRISTRATGIVGLAILCSRVLGLIREVVFAALFGAARYMDVFLTAFHAPNLLRDLLAVGALPPAFVANFLQPTAS